MKCGVAFSPPAGAPVVTACGFVVEVGVEREGVEVEVERERERQIWST